MRGAGRANWTALAAVLAVPLLAMGVVTFVRGGAAQPANVRFAPSIDIQNQGPLMNGRRVTLSEARSAVPYGLPEPPTNDKTGTLTAIWIDGSDQVAWVWKTDLRFYAHRTDRTVAEAKKGWAEWAAEEPRFRSALLTVHSLPAFAVEGDGTAEHPSTIIWLEDGLNLQFVGPGFSIKELQELADQTQMS